MMFSIQFFNFSVLDIALNIRYNQIYEVIDVTETIPFREMYEMDFDVRVCDCVKQDWKVNKIFSCINKPKKKNNFLYLNNCTARYKMKDGREIYAKGGDVVCMPKGNEYTVEFFCNEADSCTVGINAMFKYCGEDFVPEGDITIVSASSDSCMKMLFEEVNDAFMSSPILYVKIKSVFCEILSEILRNIRHEKHIEKKFEVIKDGIILMEKGIVSEISIKEIADMCNVSEIYFRRLFKEYSGVSPIEYIINSKISRAKKYLKYENISIGNIAELCGFESAAYFSRLFKKKTGDSPIRYREKFG